MKGCIKIRTRRILLAVAAGLAVSPVCAFAGVSLQWDTNPAAGIQGGFGVWNTSNSNWDNAGVASVWFNSHGDTAVFGGTAGGNVQMPSAITAAGLQIDTAGYVIGATPTSTLTISSGVVVANAAVTIAAPVSTPAGLIKSGSGVLTMMGEGTIRGTINIQQGTFAFTADAQLGGATNDIELSGGVLRLAGANSFTLGAGHGVVVDAVGGAIDTPGAKLLLGAAGQISGAGALTKSGGNVLQIAAANSSFTGSLNVAQGTIWLQNAQGINGRPIALSGGTLVLRQEQPTDFKSALNVLADSSISVDQISPRGMMGQAHSVGDATIAAGATLTVGSNSRNFLGVHNLSLAGDLRVNDSGVMVGGTFSGSGSVRFGVTPQSPGAFTTGLIFANGVSQTFGNALLPDVGASAVIGVGAATTVTYTGAWNIGGGNGSGAVSLRDGGKFVAGAGAHLNSLGLELADVGALLAVGNGVSNTFELGSSFVADHIAGGNVADGFSSLEVRDATLLSHASASLPVVLKKNGMGGVQHAGSLAFSGTGGARWVVADAAQQFEGGIAVKSSAVFQVDSGLVHSGTAGGIFENAFQIASGATLSKDGAGTLTLGGDQGYVAGAGILVHAGTVRFDTDPGEGWYAENYVRDASGKVTAAPVASGTLAISAGGGSASASVVFSPNLSQVDSIAINSNGHVHLLAGAHVGEKTVVAHSLSISGDGRFDLGNGRLILDYTGGSPIGDIRTLIKNGGITGDLGFDGSMTVGYAEAGNILHISGSQTGVIAGESVDATSIVMMVTKMGDANLDGRVNFADFQRLEAGFGKANQGWSGGDFNLDGVVNVQDFKLLNDHYGSVAEGAVAVGDVPEPSVVVLAGAVAMFLGHGRRRRRRHHGDRQAPSEPNMMV